MILGERLDFRDDDGLPLSFGKEIVVSLSEKSIPSMLMESCLFLLDFLGHIRTALVFKVGKKTPGMWVCRLVG